MVNRAVWEVSKESETLKVLYLVHRCGAYNTPREIVKWSFWKGSRGCGCCHLLNHSRPTWSLDNEDIVDEPTITSAESLAPPPPPVAPPQLLDSPSVVTIHVSEAPNAPQEEEPQQATRRLYRPRSAVSEAAIEASRILIERQYYARPRTALGFRSVSGDSVGGFRSGEAYRERPRTALGVSTTRRHAASFDIPHTQGRRREIENHMVIVEDIFEEKEEKEIFVIDESKEAVEPWKAYVPCELEQSQICLLVKIIQVCVDYGCAFDTPPSDPSNSSTLPNQNTNESLWRRFWGRLTGTNTTPPVTDADASNPAATLAPLIRYATSTMHLRLLSILIAIEMFGLPKLVQVAHQDAQQNPYDYTDFLKWQLEVRNSPDPIWRSVFHVLKEGFPLSTPGQRRDLRGPNESWMLDGELLLNAVKNRNYTLVHFLASRGALRSKRNAMPAFEYVCKRFDFECLDIFVSHRAKLSTEDFLVLHLKKTLWLRLLGPCKKNVRLLTYLVDTLDMSRTGFETICNDYLTASFVETGNVLLVKKLHEKEIELTLHNNAATLKGQESSWRISGRERDG
ncbi:hypothetical protein HDV05_002114 [Chytridiales sp. JEL 0842]|nr:hypothetical protein HDV05_002114 [Chytridiales sp. JEL 0842]